MQILIAMHNQYNLKRSRYTPVWYRHKPLRFQENDSTYHRGLIWRNDFQTIEPAQWVGSIWKNPHIFGDVLPCSTTHSLDSFFLLICQLPYQRKSMGFLFKAHSSQQHRKEKYGTSYRRVWATGTKVVYARIFQQTVGIKCQHWTFINLKCTCQNIHMVWRHKTSQPCSQSQQEIHRHQMVIFRGDLWLTIPVWPECVLYNSEIGCSVGQGQY